MTSSCSVRSDALGYQILHIQGHVSKNFAHLLSDSSFSCLSWSLTSTREGDLIVSLHAHVFYNEGGCQLTPIIIEASTLGSFDVTEACDFSIGDTEGLSAILSTVV